MYDPKTSLVQKQEFIQSKVEQYYMRFGGMADAEGYDKVHEVDISGEPFKRLQILIIRVILRFLNNIFLFRYRLHIS